MSDFQHYHLDKLRLDDTHNYLKHLRNELNLSRDELADKIGVSAHTIRRYESEWKNSKPPKWYEMLLRFMAGDVSFFGQAWADCRINLHSKKLSSPYFPEPFRPHEMMIHYNKNHLSLIQENRALHIEAGHLKEQIKQLQARIAILESEKSQLEAHKNSVKEGKVIPMFRDRKA